MNRKHVCLVGLFTLVGCEKTEVTPISAPQDKEETKNQCESPRVYRRVFYLSHATRADSVC